MSVQVAGRPWFIGSVSLCRISAAHSSFERKILNDEDASGIEGFFDHYDLL